jgi:hypothetical protein
MQKIFTKKYFMFTMGRVCRVKLFTAVSSNDDDEEVETGVRKWLRQQSQDSYAVGFDALVKRWDKRISVEKLWRNVEK